jgi:hypothetical protein
LKALLHISNSEIPLASGKAKLQHNFQPWGLIRAWDQAAQGLHSDFNWNRRPISDLEMCEVRVSIICLISVCSFTIFLVGSFVFLSFLLLYIMVT